jgi:RimJ/RimL family protein N-acetyltransferase
VDATHQPPESGFSLRTPRLVLRRWTDDDRAPFAELNADHEVMQFFPAPLDRVASDALVDRIIEQFDQEGFGLWAVEFGGRFAGFTGLSRTTYDTPMGPHVEVGWRLARWAWKQGFATEAARAALDDGFQRLGLSEVYSYTTERNVRSRAVMERLGMTRRPDLDFDHPLTPGWHGRHHVVYVALSSTSPAGRAP